MVRVNVARQIGTVEVDDGVQKTSQGFFLDVRRYNGQFRVN